MQQTAHTESIHWSPVVESREYTACDWNMVHYLNYTKAQGSPCWFGLRNEEMSWEFRSREDLYHIHDIYINKWFMLLQGPLLKMLCLQNCGQTNKKNLFPKIHWCGFTRYSNVITRTLNSMKVFSLFHGWLSSWEQRIYCEKSKQLYAIWGKHYLSNGSWALEPYCQ